LLAVLDRRDAYHERCLELFRSSREERVIPAPVVIEVVFLITTHVGPHAVLGFLDDIAEGRYRIEDLASHDYARIREIIERYADSPVGFVDAAVLAICERLNEPKLATLDHRHFGMMRPRHVDALQLLPEL
jgi:predicted nucleic acid-binding protein